MQYLIAYTSNPQLTDTSNYNVTISGAGLQVSRDFGFGVYNGCGGNGDKGTTLDQSTSSIE